MSTQSHHEINVAKRVTRVEATVTGFAAKESYRHLFATAVRSGITRHDFEAAFAEINAKFPAPEYKVTVTRWECIGYEVNVEEEKVHG